MRLRCLALCVVAAVPASAQELGVYVDTLSGVQPYVLRSFVRPNSESLFHQGRSLDSTEYAIDYRFGRLWVPNLTETDTLVVSYRTWGLSLDDRYSRPLVRVQDLAKDDSTEQANRRDSPISPRREWSLSRSGSITRGVLAGNNRDAIIESGLRLQLEGEVAEDVRVRAMLTDESTPILPEGTTQRLNELDRVYIEITSKPGVAQLGDFDVSYETSEFSRLKRKVQGIGITAQSPFSNTQGQFEALGATARGFFRRQKLQISDGVQGPYRLQGEQSEQFIFIIPGSEEVYLDGQLLVRGQTRDYVVDYATGEITFTTNRLIRDHDRVVVEFQYRASEFTRTLIGTSTDVSIGIRPDNAPLGSLGVTFLREADGRNLSEAYGLTSDDETLLQNAGDSLAQRSGAVAVTFDPEAHFVQYTQQDTLYEGARYSIFSSLTSRPTGQAYRVSFSRVGPGKGSYVRQGRSTNGLVYVWRGPGRGEYEPVRILPKPRQQRMLDFRGTIAPVRNIELFGEWAQSLYDQNRFSSLDKADDSAHAYTAGIRLEPISIGVGNISLSASRRHTGRGFATFSRIRPVEFERLWNLNSIQTESSRSNLTAENETIDEATLKWEASALSGLSVQAGRLNLGPLFDANRGEITTTLGEEGWPALRYSLSAIRSQDRGQNENGTWLDQEGHLSMPILGEKVIPEFRLQQTRRILKTVERDSLVAPSHSFFQVTPGVTWRTPMGEVGSFVDLRTDEKAVAGALQQTSEAVTWDVRFNLKPTRLFRTEGRVGLRNLKVDNATNTSAAIRWSGRLTPWERALQLQWFYEALSERTPTLQEIYIRTGPELGEYVWVDANGNGVIELDEFLPEASQDEGNYVRSLIPSDSLQSVTGLQARFSVRLDPSRLWRESGARLRRILRHVSMRTSINVREKSRNPRLSDIYLLRLGTFRSPDYTLKGQWMLQQELSFFRGIAEYGIDLSYRSVRGLSELAAGSETRAIDEYRLSGQLRLDDRWGTALTTSTGTHAMTSESFATRNYSIDAFYIEPEVSFNFTSSLQVALSVSHGRKDTGPIRASLWKIPLEVTFARARKLNVSGRFEAASVLLRGGDETAGLARFEITDGRGSGTSFMWTLSSWFQLSSVLRATLTYNGRNPESAPAIHTVRMQLSAIF